MINCLHIDGVDSVVSGFVHILDEMMKGEQSRSWAHLTTAVVFAGRLTQHSFDKGYIEAGSVDQLVSLLTESLIQRLESFTDAHEELQRFYKRYRWKRIFMNALVLVVIEAIRIL
jgi:hypothetical protein